MKKFTVFLIALAVACMFGSAAYAGLDDGLMAYYPFSGNANDASGNGNDGTVHGATLTEDRLGNANSAYNFDGVNDYLEVPKINLDGSSFSISAWINLSDISGYNTIYSNGEGSIYWDDGIRYFGIADGFLMFMVEVWGFRQCPESVPSRRQNVPGDR